MELRFGHHCRLLNWSLSDAEIQGANRHPQPYIPFPYISSLSFFSILPSQFSHNLFFPFIFLIFFFTKVFIFLYFIYWWIINWTCMLSKKFKILFIIKPCNKYNNQLLSRTEVKFVRDYLWDVIIITNVFILIIELMS